MVVTRLCPQPAVAAVLGLLVLIALGEAWLRFGWAGIGARDVIIAGVLVCWVTTGYKFPIHVERSQKVEMVTISLFLMAALLPSPPLAASAAGIGILAGELMVRKERGNYMSDVATATCRWMLAVLAGSTFYHASGGHGAFSLFGTAVVIWVCDILSIPLLMAPITGHRPLRFMLSNVRTSGLMEGVQYLLGMLGALAASVEIWALGLLVPPTILVYMALKNVKEVRSNTRLILESMADTVDLRDPYTGGHSQRVADMTARILRTMNLHGPEVDLVVSAARVHDIGKIGIPDAVLNKPGRLTPEEEAIMRTHPDHGAGLLKRYPDFVRGVDIVRHHHEAWDGSCYPQGLKGASIPFGARVIAVADSFDAMTSDRPYRKAMPIQKAASILSEGRWKQWDGVIVDAFLETIAEELERTPAPAPAAQIQPSTPLVQAPQGV